MARPPSRFFGHKIPCMICGDEFKHITISHLKIHGYTMEQYREESPDAPLWSDEFLERFSKSMSSEKNPMRSKKPGNYGKLLSEETKERVSESLKRYFEEHPEARKKISEARTGVPLSEEHKRKLREANLGKTLSEEHRRNIGEAKKGKRRASFSEETRQKMSETRKEKFRSGELKLSPLIGRGRAGFYEDLNHYYRSLWEANLARVLIHENISYQYEPERFGQGNTTYLPDFYIQDSDLYLEVKGFMTPKDQAKIDLFSKDHDLLVIGPEEYYELEERYENIIENWDQPPREHRKTIQTDVSSVFELEVC